MSITLNQIITLVGKLDDASTDNTPRERFRQFLKDNVNEVGQIRDYIEECLRNSGSQYSRALQDLINHLGRFLGFEVNFGRYQGVQGQIGFDGHWRSPSGFHIVIEVKTTEVYSINVATLANYINDMISSRKIPDWNNVLGLYIIGRPNPDIRQLENSIIAEKRTDQIRIIAVDSLLTMAEMMVDYDISHDDILAVIRPSGPRIDSIVGLMARLVAGSQGTQLSSDDEPLPREQLPLEVPIAEDICYWLTPVKADDEQTAEDLIQKLIGREQIYAFGDRTPGRKHLKPGDRICFYATGTGVIAHARVASYPENGHHPSIPQPERYSWIFRVDDVSLYPNEPIVIDATLRVSLDAFQERSPEGRRWAWFVQAARRLTEHDFKVLTRQDSK